MDENRLVALAKRIAKSFHNSFPRGTTAEDAEQDAIVLILEWRAQIDQEAHLYMKVRGILYDRYISEWKKQHAHQEVPLLDPGEEPGGVEYEVREDVGRAVQALPPRLRRVIKLHLEGLNQKEIAARLGYHQPYVSGLLKKAKDKLRELLGAEGYE